MLRSFIVACSSEIFGIGLFSGTVPTAEHVEALEIT